MESRSIRAGRGGDTTVTLQRIVVLLLLVCAAVKLRAYLADGLPIFFDAHSHLARVWMTHEAIASGHFPSWSNAWYGGYRLLEFYSPLYYWVTAAIAFIAADVVAATKLTLWLGQIAAVGAFYGFLRRAVTKSPWIAAFGAAAFLVSAERAVALGSIGNHPSVLLYVGVPVLLSICHAFASGRIDLPRFVGFHSLMLAALASAHLTNLLAILPSLIVCEFALVYGGFASRGRSEAGSRVAAMALAASLTATLGACSFLLVPMLLDLGQVSLSLALDAPSTIGTAALESVFGFANHDVDRPFAQDQGLVWWLLAATATLLSISKRHAAARPFAVGLIACLASIVLTGERSALALIIFIAPLAAIALERASDELAARSLQPVAIALPGVALLAVLLAPQPRADHDPHYLPDDTLALYQNLPETGRASRTFDITETTISVDGLYGWSSFSPFYSGRSIAFGAFPQGAPLAHHISMALASEVVRDLAHSPPTLSQASADILYWLHVEFLVDRGLQPGERARPGVPLSKERLARATIPRTVGELQQPGVFQLRHASPIVFAPRIEALPETPAGPTLLAMLRERWAEDPLGQHPDPSLDILRRSGAKRDAALLAPYLAAMQLDRANARAQLLYLEQRDATRIAQPAQLAAIAPRGNVFRVESHLETPTRVEITATSDDAGFARIAYSFDEGQEVTLDGTSIAHFPDPLGTGVVVAFPAGTHTLVLDASSTREILPWFIASITVWMGLGLLCWSLPSASALPESGQ